MSTEDLSAQLDLAKELLSTLEQIKELWIDSDFPGMEEVEDLTP